MSIVKFHEIVELINIFLPYYVVMHHIYVWHHYLEFDFVRDLNHKVSNSKKNIQNIKLVDNIYVLYRYTKDAHDETCARACGWGFGNKTNPFDLILSTLALRTLMRKFRRAHLSGSRSLPYYIVIHHSDKKLLSRQFDLIED
jgi:hypothetical protein